MRARLYQAQKVVHISLRVKWQFKLQVKTWAARAGMTYGDFLADALIEGARAKAMRMGAHRKEDDFEFDEDTYNEFKPIELKGGNH